MQRSSSIGSQQAQPTVNIGKRKKKNQQTQDDLRQRAAAGEDRVQDPMVLVSLMDIAYSTFLFVGHRRLCKMLCVCVCGIYLPEAG